MLDFQRLGWPADPERIAAYKQNEQLFEGDHMAAFADLSAKVPANRRKIVYIVENFASLIAKASADLLFGNAPVFSGGPNEEAQRSLDEVVRQNNLRVTLYEGALAAAYRGDAVFRVGVGARPGEEPQVLIDELPASSYFVERDPDNARRVLSEAIAWTREEEDGSTFLRVEHHVPGWVGQEAFRLDTVVGKARERVPLAALYDDPDQFGDADEGGVRWRETGIQESLLQHVPNYRAGHRYWGYSDFSPDLKSIFDAVNNRISKISSILDRHASPKLVLPYGAVDRDGKVAVANLEVFEGDSEYLRYVPRYVTWEAHLDACFQELEHLADAVFKFSEIAPAVFGLDKAGSIESGRAMRMRFVRTDAMVARKRLYFDPAVRRVLRLAQQLKRLYFNGPEPVEVAIHWKSGIPKDMVEQVDVEATRVEAGLTSRQQAIRRLDDATEAQALEELERIRREAAPPEPQATQ